MHQLQFLTPLVALRLVCGFFFLPHAVGKFTAKQAAFGFFRKAGFKPAELFGYTAMTIEVIFGALLLGGIFVSAAAWAACAYLVIATLAVIKVERKWLWHIGGCEYPFFWALCCAIVGAYT